MAVITLDDLETWMKTTFDDATAAQAQLMVDYINQLIADECNTVFGPETGSVQRCRADADGRIVFFNIPVADVSVVHDYRTDADLSTDVWCFDGIDTVSGLYPGQVVDVTMDFGWPTVPASVKGVALAMAGRGVGQLTSNTPAGVTLKQVGDVIVEYGDVMAPTPTESAILAVYAITEGTIEINVQQNFLPRLGRSYLMFPDVSYMPGDWCE